MNAETKTRKGLKQMRDRLIELLGNANKICGKRFREETKAVLKEKGHFNSKTDRTESFNEITADYLIENGVIVPPCKVGDKVYYFSHHPFNLSVLPNTIYEADVVRIVTTRLGTSVVIQIHNDYGCTEIPEISSFGKTVFLTKEEAEKALRGEGE